MAYSQLFTVHRITYDERDVFFSQTQCRQAWPIAHSPNHDRPHPY
jgi:hypothetical protein